MIQNIIFDWSGTLIDDLPAVWNATNHVFHLAGIELITLERFRAEFCLPFQKFYDRYTPHVPMAQLEEWFHAYFNKVRNTVVEMPHARAFLECCRRRSIRMFVLSTMHPAHFEVQAAATGFREYFARAYTGILDKQQKIMGLLEENQLDPGQTLLVGDMQHDIDTAKHGGVFACAVLTGYSSAEMLRASQPDWIVENLDELRQRLDQANWQPRR